MASPAQITANQANALKSTGPRSAEGKFASRFNALKHGIDAQSTVIPGENPDDLAALTNSYVTDVQPENFAEDFHIETMVRALWQKRRLQRVEADLTGILLDQNPGNSLAAAILTGSPAAKLLARTQRQIASHERAWYRAHKELLLLRAQQDKAQRQAIDRFRNSYRGQEVPAELALFRQREKSPAPPIPAPSKSAKSWPPVDENTGQPLYFVG